MKVILRSDGICSCLSLGLWGARLMAMLVGMARWHDVFLLSSYAAWVLVGRGRDEFAPRDVPRSERVVSTG